jgi:hypothetical protein
MVAARTPMYLGRLIGQRQNERFQLSSTLRGTFPIGQVHLSISMLPQTEPKVTDELISDIDNFTRRSPVSRIDRLHTHVLCFAHHAQFFHRSQQTLHTRMQAPVFTHMTNDHSHMDERAQRDASPWYNGIFHLANSTER